MMPKLYNGFKIWRKYERFEKVLSEEKAQRMWAFVKDPSKNDEKIDRIASLEQVRRSSADDRTHLIKPKVKENYAQASGKLHHPNY